jgi:hypothetical protein
MAPRRQTGSWYLTGWYLSNYVAYLQSGRFPAENADAAARSFTGLVLERNTTSHFS